MQPSHVPITLGIADKFPCSDDLLLPLCAALCVEGLEGRESSVLGDTAPVEGFPSKEHDLRLCTEDGGLCRHWQSILVQSVRHSI